MDAEERLKKLEADMQNVIAAKDKEIEELKKQLEEAKKTDCVSEEAGPYSITYAFGGFLSIICC